MTPEWCRFGGGANNAKPVGVDLLFEVQLLHRCRPGTLAYRYFHYAKAVRYAKSSGIDVLWHGRDGQIEHDFTLAPGADPRRNPIFHPRREPGTQH